MPDAYDMNKGLSFNAPTVWAMTTAPAVTNDVNNGKSVGDIWINTTASNAYICMSNAAGAAVWTRFNAA